MDQSEKIGIINQHLHVDRDSLNKSNRDNKHIFNQIMQGNMESDMVNYLMNLGYMRLSDIKSISKYNEMNIAAHINEANKEEEILDGQEINLPKPKTKIKGNLIDILESRKSVRHYSPTKMSIKDLSTILKYSFGISKRKKYYKYVTVSTRYYASGGGLYPVDLYILTNNIENLGNMLYRYQSHSHTLYPVVNDFDIDNFLISSNFDMDNYSFLTLYEYDINKNYLKYGELSLLNTLVEVGNMAHGLDIISASLGFGTCQIAGFDKKYANDKLNLDSVNSNIIFTSICGLE